MTSLKVQLGTSDKQPRKYTVRLYFAELYGGFTTAGQRVFDVKLQGAVALAGMDAVEAGGRRFGASGAGDAAAGVKVALAAEQGRRPESALLVHVGLPVGASEITSDRFDPSWRLSFAHTLSERLSFGYNLGMAWASEETAPGTVETFSFGEYTAALGIGLGDRLGAFVELFGEIPIDAPGGAAHLFDGGFTYLLRPNLQLDLAGGVGLTDDAPDWFVGAGVSWRWPH